MIRDAIDAWGTVSILSLGAWVWSGSRVFGAITRALNIALWIIWAWILALILLLGGEFVSHIQSMSIEGKSGDETEARHKQRAPNKA